MRKVNFTVDGLLRWAEQRNAHIEWADEYGEPGYTTPERGILFADWNDVPQSLQDRLEREGYELEWSDEWYVETGTSPSKAWRTQPDSMGWEPQCLFCDGYVLTPDDDLSEWVAECKDDANHALPSRYSQEDIENLGWLLIDELDYITQTRNEHTIARDMRANGDSYLFQRCRRGVLKVYSDRLEWSSSLHCFSLRMRLDDAESASGQGDCTYAVECLLETKYIGDQLSAIDPEKIRAELQEYGAWDDAELSDADANRQRLVWVAACDIAEQHRHN